MARQYVLPIDDVRLRIRVSHELFLLGMIVVALWLVGFGGIKGKAINCAWSKLYEGNERHGGEARVCGRKDWEGDCCSAAAPQATGFTLILLQGRYFFSDKISPVVPSSDESRASKAH